MGAALIRRIPPFCAVLSVEDELGQFNGIHNLAVLVYAHIAGCNFVDEDDFAVVVTEFKLDIPEVETNGLEVVSNDLGDL